REKTQLARIPPLPTSVHERTVALTLGDPPGETTYWTAAMMAKAVGISVSSVQRIWRAHGLQPRRMRQFKLSHDPDFVPELRDIVGSEPALGPGTGRTRGSIGRRIPSCSASTRNRRSRRSTASARGFKVCHRTAPNTGPGNSSSIRYLSSKFLEM